MPKLVNSSACVYEQQLSYC